MTTLHIPASDTYWAGEDDKRKDYWIASPDCLTTMDCLIEYTVARALFKFQWCNHSARLKWRDTRNL